MSATAAQTLLQQWVEREDVRLVLVGGTVDEAGVFVRALVQELPPRPADQDHDGEVLVIPGVVIIAMLKTRATVDELNAAVESFGVKALAGTSAPADADVMTLGPDPLDTIARVEAFLMGAAYSPIPEGSRPS